VQTESTVIEKIKLDSLIDRITALLPKTDGPLATELRKNLRATLTNALARMDLVKREEFDVQTAVLARTRARLEELEKQVKSLEETLASRSQPRDGS
jgi:BMFP domain-containing protein YqiC